MGINKIIDHYSQSIRVNSFGGFVLVAQDKALTEGLNGGTSITI